MAARTTTPSPLGIWVTTAPIITLLVDELLSEAFVDAAKAEDVVNTQPTLYQNTVVVFFAGPIPPQFPGMELQRIFSGTERVHNSIAMGMERLHRQVEFRSSAGQQEVEAHRCILDLLEREHDRLLAQHVAEDPGVREPHTAEEVLSDADFERAFGCSRTVFHNLRPWKQRQLRKSAGFPEAPGGADATPRALSAASIVSTPVSAQTPSAIPAPNGALETTRSGLPRGFLGANLLERQRLMAGLAGPQPMDCSEAGATGEAAQVAADAAIQAVGCPPISFDALPYMRLKRFLISAGVASAAHCSNKDQVVALARQHEEIDYTVLLQDAAAQRAAEADAARRRQDDASRQRDEASAAERRKAEAEAADRTHVTGMAQHYSTARLAKYVETNFDALLPGFGVYPGDQGNCLRRVDGTDAYSLLQSHERSSHQSEARRLNRTEATAYMVEILALVMRSLLQGCTICEAREVARNRFWHVPPDAEMVRGVLGADWEGLDM